MEWLKGILKSLPLESISEVLAEVVLWWTRMVEGVPEEQLAFYTYVGGSLSVLALLYFCLRLLPKGIAGFIWILSVAILFTPGSTIGESGGVAPAIIGVAHSLLMGESGAAMTLFLPILAMTIALLIIGALWQMLKGAISAAIAREKASKTVL